MAYSATVLEIMIASPGDVSSERQLIREVALEWNDLNTHSERVVLLPVGWETRAAPDLAGRAQGLVNERVLARCDLLVGVFWTRIGSATGDHESGSVEEIKRHVDFGKPAMIYFSSQPVAPASIDGGQFERVRIFKDWCQERGIVGTFNNTPDFGAQLRRDLTNILRDNPYLRQQVGNRGIHSSEISQAPPTASALSPTASQLLLSAANSKAGTVLMVRHMNGTVFQTGAGEIVHDGSQREIARLAAAVEQLEDFGLIRDRGHKREVFEVTEQGYQVADELSQQASSMSAE
jgi:hypothetical protein